MNSFSNKKMPFNMMAVTLSMRCVILCDYHHFNNQENMTV